ncbi:MAG: PilT/PilU family type 4a pilus ATPase, partial [Candidatus Parcubacteria bacterium]|nr:PilT/PilU family type 4a pilus ATPase [Candidatus Parcubacteria bacterium]
GAPVLENKELTEAIYKTLTDIQRQHFEEDWELDYGHQIDSNRFRINVHYQLGQIAMAARLIPDKIPSGEEIALEPILYELTHLQQGFILVTGPTGCGKSTTLATMIDIINQERRAHVITLEDPIEFLYPAKQSVIEQREVGRDTRSFYGGLKHVLRQDPNVILIGEMRDPETIAAALTAAETGHLVFSTLHTNSAAETMERIIDSFDSNRQRQILIQLASALSAVVTQQLVPTTDGKMAAAREIMANTPAISNLIRQNKIAQIQSVIQTSKSDGMVTMNNSLKKLFQEGKITEATYNHRLTSSEKIGSYF